MESVLRHFCFKSIYHFQKKSVVQHEEVIKRLTEKFSNSAP